MDGLALQFVLLDKVRLEVAEAVETFPREQFVIARRDVAHIETAGLIGRGCLEKVGTVPVLVRDEDGLNTPQRLIFAIANQPVDLSDIRAEDDVEGRRAAAALREFKLLKNPQRDYGAPD